MANIKNMKHNTAYRVTKGNTDGGIVAGDIVSYDSSYLVMWDGKDTGMYDSKDLSDPHVSDFECELAEEYRVETQGRIHICKLTGNRMAEVAALFGKKLGEEFRTKDGGLMYAFDSVGLAEYGIVYNNEMLRKLLTGEAEIVEE